MNSPIKFLRRVRIHGGECGAVARALHHKAKVHSLPAVFENVSSTTFERKLMSTKTSFKRISLAVIVALGLGVLATGPSANAAIDETFTLSASSATINVGETATVTVTNTYISETTIDSSAVWIAGGASNGSTVYARLLTTGDTLNVATGTAPSERSQTSSNIASSARLLDSTNVVSAGALTKNQFTVKFYAPTTAGTYTYTFTSRSIDGVVIKKAATYVLTVTAEDTTAVATKSLMYIQDSPVAIIGNPVLGDSTLVKSAGAIATPVAAGYIVFQPRNASDTKTAVAGGAVTGTLTVNISGPGSLSKGLHSAVTARVKSLSLSLGETATIWSDGTPGTATLTGYIGATTLTQAAKTMTFFGPATTFAVTVESATVTRGDTANGVITFTAKDAAGNAVESAALQTNGFTNFYAISSDTNVINSNVVRTVGNKHTVCDYVSARSKFVCNLGAVDSGTATITISDSPTATTVASAAVTLKVAGTGNTGTITLPKSTYNVGEKAIITVTSKDGAGNNVANGPSTPFTGLRWGSTAPTFGAPTGSDATGGDAVGTALASYLASSTASSYRDGVETLVVYMPSTVGTYTLIGLTGTSTAEATLLTFTVSDPAAAATLAAAEAATDAAAEAIDAANAATDAANLAAEAADAATVAAEEARDAADAATAAVEELATAVATLMAALKAQVTTLANTVAKIAKKVGVKK